jgi:hypothetical protein
MVWRRCRIGDGAYDQDGVHGTVMKRDPDAAVVVPPRATAVPSETATSEPTQRERHLQSIAEKGRIAWQRMSGYNKRSRVEAIIGRISKSSAMNCAFTKTIVAPPRATVAVHVMNRILELGRPLPIRIA